jgi:CheY-like chemotaxis protein
MAPVILVVDDEVAIGTNLAAYLEDEGMDVHVVESGEEALRRIHAGLEVDVCIMDIRLPGINGNETVMAIHRLTPGIRFLIHTGSTNYSIPEALQRIGVTEVQVFYKPVVDMAKLAQAVRTLGTAGNIPTRTG